MPRPEPFPMRHHARTRLGVLVAAGEDGVGASVTASLLAREARADGARVLIVGPALRAQRIAAMFGIAMPSWDDAPVRLERDIHVCATIPDLCDADVIISVPSARALVLLDAVDELCAHTSPTSALILAPKGGPSLAATFAVLKLIIGRRPQCSASVAACGEADVSPLFDAAERWLGHPLSVAPAIPIDPTLPVALGAGILLAEAVASTALTTAAGALWSALATSAIPGALA